MLHPEEIFQKIEDAPPFQRKKVALNYLGIKVSWKLVYGSAYSLLDNSIMVRAGSKDSIFSRVCFLIDIEKYPEFKVLEKGHFLWIDGEISDIDTLTITLDKINVRFQDEEKTKEQKTITHTFINSQVHLGQGDMNNNHLTNSPVDLKTTPGFFEKITNNQTFAIIIGGLLLAYIFYIVYSYFGLNLVNFVAQP